MREGSRGGPAGGEEGASESATFELASAERDSDASAKTGCHANERGTNVAKSVQIPGLADRKVLALRPATSTRRAALRMPTARP